MPQGAPLDRVQAWAQDQQTMMLDRAVEEDLFRTDPERFALDTEDIFPMLPPVAEDDEERMVQRWAVIEGAVERMKRERRERTVDPAVDEERDAKRRRIF